MVGVEVKIGVFVEVGSLAKVFSKFELIHAIFVHARFPFIHLHLLHELSPVSFPAHPSSTFSPLDKTQNLSGVTVFELSIKG